ncbi:hypothetical protein [Streptomyces cinereospinus]|uniref:Uncharacterized protein n=1 Tax=Streptomyces cinereospinus TaxID=285561 RepID=A0ABV5N8L8_9ACTN
MTGGRRDQRVAAGRHTTPAELETKAGPVRRAIAVDGEVGLDGLDLRPARPLAAPADSVLLSRRRAKFP